MPKKTSLERTFRFMLLKAAKHESLIEGSARHTVGIYLNNYSISEKAHLQES